MATKERLRPRLKKLDDLFLLDQENGAKNNAVQPISDSGSRYRKIVDIDTLAPFPDHPFRLYEGERLDDMVESVRKNGVLVPIIAREKDGRLEILSGHNRVNASRLAGRNEIPADILRNVTDEEAWIYIIETNLMQRSFADMSHSEKAAVITLYHSKMFSQGKRNDILEQLKTLEYPHIQGEKETCAEIQHKLKSRDIVAKEYGLKRDAVVCYLRVHKLIPELKLLLDNDKFVVSTAASISFLKESEQTLVASCMELNGFHVDMKKADTLRQYSEAGKLDSDTIFLILNGEIGKKPKPNRTPVVKVNKAVYARYFKPNQPAKEVQEIVEKALELYFRPR